MGLLGSSSTFPLLNLLLGVRGGRQELRSVGWTRRQCAWWSGRSAVILSQPPCYLLSKGRLPPSGCSLPSIRKPWTIGIRKGKT